MARESIILKSFSLMETPCLLEVEDNLEMRVNMRKTGILGSDTMTMDTKTMTYLLLFGEKIEYMSNNEL